VQGAEIVVVGAGPAGLSTAGALKKLGLTAVILDRDDVIGSSWLQRYDRLHLHTIRRFSGLAHFPIPRSYPKYLSRDMYAEYLRSYVRRFSINVVHKCNVELIRSNGASGRHNVYAVKTEQGTWNASTVVIATGMFGKPLLPAIPEIECYRGLTLHASAYKNGREYTGKRVLIVGLGNTGAEIAADLVEQGAEVAVSIRSTPPIVPRDFLATPVQLFGIMLSRVPPSISDRIGTTLARVALGDLTRYGLQKPAWLPFSARRIPVIDVGFVRALKRRQVVLRSLIERFSEDGVIFADGRAETFDVVIFATGYRTGLETTLDVPGLLDGVGYPKFASGEKTPAPGLYFMGFIESHRGLLFEIDIATRHLARTIAYTDVGCGAAHFGRCSG
jgi:putative flavoprotein involved in K+ transport